MIIDFSRPNVMVDLETMSTRHDAAIVSIGAVIFNEEGPLTPLFYNVVDMASAQRAGLHVDAETVSWWLTQSDGARSALMKQRLPLSVALSNFRDWLPKSSYVWGNGASFDNVVLSNAYTALGAPRPWHYWNDMCYRTIKNLHPGVTTDGRTGTKHNALDDAITQVDHLLAIYRHAYD